MTNSVMSLPRTDERTMHLPVRLRLVSVADAERRRQERRPENEAGVLRAPASGLPEDVDVHVVDISETGLGLESKHSLVLGANVHIRSKRTTFLGTVRHCTETAAGFHIGVQVEEVFAF